MMRIPGKLKREVRFMANDMINYIVKGDDDWILRHG